ncbi:MAG: multidrug ABC transporter substrate-binding protein [Candidatus Nealsonbacteria bacterium CG_4_10_14_0_2_um_filter_38_17]|uniref:Multidrug ABC transporter substrate-binding protein n=2 Tax=Candidatus Nealsoniibacteriota TaxID=1817911 RepID=A0A2M7UX73_9BACT|nr:MAG: multidrug ABC transporter substrate-binding protein [Candidatus Nealsonbacteria bacterium CG23_combo_of_CG06-09_8_20_14_all_38_19]PIZ88557.1 MAG: multidrug ABC transporter substrate-binding protein [Candidatus Nealsonbacteria bacterium CG_4_10_14_0_2_um_filter_38_17]
MKWSESFFTAIDGLKANKSRSALTILGIVIGIAAVIAMMAIGKGAQGLILSQIATLGSNNIFIEPGPWSKNMERGTLMQSMVEEMEIKTLKYEDALAIEKIQNVDKVAPLVIGVDRVIAETESKKVTYLGTTPQMIEISDLRCYLGRCIEDYDVKSNARVAVLGYKLKKDLFGDENPVGKKVRIKKTTFKIIGVAEEKGVQSFLNMDELVHMPITTAQEFLTGADYIRWIAVKVKDENLIDQTIEDIRLLLRERHNIYNPSGDLTKDDFKVVSQKETADVLGQITSIFTVLLSCIAAISLVVGGIGIMNIMLVSVTERTREVGLRKAVGARKKDILLQFLFEAVLLTLIGGVLGIVLGAFISWVTSFVFGQLLNTSWGFLLPLNAVLLGVGVSVAIGLIFGMYPAQKAAKLNPIEALRYE